MLASVLTFLLAVSSVIALPKQVILDYNTKQLNLIELSPSRYALELNNIDTLVKHDTNALHPDLIGPTRVQNIRFNFEYRNDHLVIGGKRVKEGVTQIYAMAQIPDHKTPTLFSEGIVGMEVDITIQKLHMETFVDIKVLILEINGDKLNAMAASMVLVAEEVHGQIRSHKAHKYEKVLYLSILIFAVAWILIFVVGSIIAVVMGKHRYQAIAVTDESEKPVKTHVVRFEEKASM
jgi:hypothetical protein